MFLHTCVPFPLHPGEYYVDAAQGILYFYPPAPLASAPAYLSMAETGVSLAGTAYVTLDGFSVSFARRAGIDAQNVEVRKLCLRGAMR